jgi:hypothetical protein
MTARVSPMAWRWEAWSFVAAAILAVAVGTFARGFVGQEWFFTTDNLAHSLPLAPPFLVAAGVVVGVDRWSPGRSWLLAGAWLLALHGALQVILEVQFASIINSAGDVAAAKPWILARGVLSGASHALGFGALAAGMWRSRIGEWRGIRRVTAIGLAAVTGLMAVGPLSTSIMGPAAALAPLDALGFGLTGLGVLAAGALAIAGLLAAPKRAPIPELLIAAGAAIYVVGPGLAWWAFAIVPPDAISLLVLTNVGVATAALLAIAIGFGSGAYFGSAED